MISTLQNTATSCIFFIVLASTAIAQESNEQNDVIFGSDQIPTESELLGLLELGPPTLPLFTLMGVSAEGVISPQTSAEIGAAIVPQAINAFGQEATQIGLSINPGLLLLDDEVSANDLVRETRFGTPRQLSRLSFSVAYSRDVGEQAKTQAGLGLSYTYDAKSPIQAYPEYSECVDRATRGDLEILDSARTGRNDEITTLIRPLGLPFDKEIELIGQIGSVLNGPQAQQEKELRRIAAENELAVNEDRFVSELLEVASRFQAAAGQRERNVTAAVRACVAEATAWNRPLYAFGIAGYQTDFPEADDRDGYTAWFSLANPLGENGQAILSARYYEGLAREVTSDGMMIADYVDGWTVGARYTHQISAEIIGNLDIGRATRGFVEAAYTEESFGELDDEYWQGAIGAEVRLDKGTYAQFIVGRSWGSEIDREDFISAQLKWSLTRSPL